MLHIPTYEKGDLSELDLIDLCNLTRRKLGRELKTQEIDFLEWVYNKHKLEEENTNSIYPIA